MQDAANLFFQLVSSRYEHASLIRTSNLSPARWGEVLGYQVVAAALIARIVHHAGVINFKDPATDSRPPNQFATPDKTRECGSVVPSTRLSFHLTNGSPFDHH
ncbi:hypothetical protein MB46_07570 [Arthrobacter alpinus]|uniref:ATP-binding protein n=1 Tax=Arthrobacter alpinus TaxID=656366 RepID=UPI0005C945F4|nr:hypothetical protein MB46_07570 [Arthrobacter alpinus]